MAYTSTHLDTPVRLLTVGPERVTVTDHAHPLYGRTFDVVAPAGTVGAWGQVTVAYRDDILLKIPVVATSLHLASPHLPSSKLSADSIRELVRIAREFESPETQRSTWNSNKDCLMIDEDQETTDLVDSPRERS